MEQLHYMIEDKTIAYLMGENNFTTDESAILELVKNAYDAQALDVSITFLNDSIVIEDNGIGMNEHDIYDSWMHVGKSKKIYDVLDEKKQVRVLAGSKGIGRFALARLGENIKLYSKKLGNNGVLWETDWNHSFLTYDEEIGQLGTKIIISKLRAKWGKKKVQDLVLFLSKTYNDTVMRITVMHPEINCEIQEYFPEPQVGKNCLSAIRLNYDSNSKKLITNVLSDEFLNDAKQYCSELDIQKAYIESDLLDEIKASDYDLTEEELKIYLEKLGSFFAQFYFYIKPTTADVEKFMYKHSGLSDALPSGVILYRNAFSISAYEGKKDWLNFGKRSRKSPAAASHPTGAWRVRENQIAGKVEIDRKRNAYLIDLSNRQGLEENVYFHLLIEIVHIGIGEFERYRQRIIRAINVKNVSVKEINTPVADRINKNPRVVSRLSEQEAKQLVNEIRSFREESKEAKKEKEDTEIRYKYDIRILNMLATVGLKASSIAHEMRSDRNSISSNTERIIDALKAYGMWDELNSPEKTNHVYNNVPYLLKSNNEISIKLVAFMNAMLSDVEKKKFEPIRQSVADILNRIKASWESDYAWVNIQMNMKEDVVCYIPEDVLQVIFDNLILNSIQQNENNNHLLIDIEAKRYGKLLSFVYKDNGKGLAKKYISVPRKILEVHETTRRNGHGLGMWIVNNTVTMSGGSVDKISGNQGFLIEFTIGGLI